MSAFGASFLQFPNDPTGALNPGDCYPYLEVYAPLVTAYLAHEVELAAVHNQTIANLIALTLKALEETNSTITVKSGEILEKALAPIVSKLNSGFYALAERVRCGVQPVLCASVARFSEITSIKNWSINFIKAPQNSY